MICRDQSMDKSALVFHKQIWYQLVDLSVFDGDYR